MSSQPAARGAVVTGGTRGLGREISVALAEAGFAVEALFGADHAAAAELSAFAKANALAIECVNVDLADVARIDAYAARVGERMRFHVLVNNASSDFELLQFPKWDLATLDRLLDVNVRAAFRLSQLAVTAMKRLGGGRIVNILSSNTVFEPAAGASGYTVAKYALLGLTRALAVELAQKNITVNAVSPVAMDCGIYTRWPEHLREAIAEKLPAGRPVSAKSVAGVVRFLVSDEGATLNGVNIPVTA